MNICVFCGSSPGRVDVYADAARELGEELVRRRLGLVYGGGAVGLMGILADAVLDCGGEVVGVIPHGLATREIAHEGLTDLRVVRSMHERKQTMVDLADGFIAMPGGLGTFEEILEVLTWAQLGIHRKPCGLLDVDGYWQPLLALLRLAEAEGFVKRAHRGLVQHAPTAGLLLDGFAQYEPPPVPAWLDRSET